MKFMKKNKKGFTLVELMIVVVIMAILVAVAVPIYSAVTDNARTKTCIANQREIVSQMNTFTMGVSGGFTPTAAFSWTITTGANGDSGVYAVSNSGGMSSLTTALISGMFTTPPYCPVANSVITCTVSYTGSVFSVATACTQAEHKLVK